MSKPTYIYDRRGNCHRTDGKMGVPAWIGTILAIVTITGTNALFFGAILAWLGVV